MGIEVVRFQTGINLSQRKYILDLLEDMDLLGARPVEFQWILIRNY
jgi:hypothetical protein